MHCVWFCSALYFDSVFSHLQTPLSSRMGVKNLVFFFLVLSLCLDGGSAKEKGKGKGKKKGKQVFCPS